MNEKKPNPSISVLGGGQFGVVFANLLAENQLKPRLWFPNAKDANQFEKERNLKIFGHSYHINHNIQFVSGLSLFQKNSHILYCIMPAIGFEDRIETILKSLDPQERHIIVILTKGFVNRTIRKKLNIYTFSQYCQILAEQLKLNLEVTVLTGPSLLGEILDGQFTFFNLGCKDPKIYEMIQAQVSNDFVNVRCDQDILGVELGGIMKNPVAIASGMVKNLPRCGSNLMGVLLSQGFIEINNFYNALGLAQSTLNNISGLGDLLTSSISPYSRNRAFGESLVYDYINHHDKLSVSDRFELLFSPKRFIEKQTHSGENSVEGGISLHPILEIAQEKKISMPLFQRVHDILIRKKTPDSIIELFSNKFDTKISKTKPKNKYVRGAVFSAGHNFNKLITRRVRKQLALEGSLQKRILRQSSNILSKLQNRISQAQDKNIQREIEEFPKEIRMWQELNSASELANYEYLDELINYYVNEISDNFHPIMRGSLIRTLAPLRFMASGFRPGSGLPYVGGRIQELKELSRQYNIMYAPMHRSHLDSVELAFGLLSKGLPVPRYAAGINLMTSRFWSWLLKSLGGYAVDRQRIRNILYLQCLNAYSSMILEAGVPSLVYCEGTRSRTGGIYPIKTGLLTTALDAWHSSGNETLIVPVTLSYENVPEDLEFHEIDQSTSATHFLYGRTKVYMDICDPIYVSEFAGNDDPTLSIAYEIDRQWRKYQRLLPNHIIAHLLCDNQGQLAMNQLDDLLNEILVSNKGNYLTNNPARIQKEGIKALKKRKFIKIKDKQILSLKPDYIRYYANMLPFTNYF